MTTYFHINFLATLCGLALFFFSCETASEKQGSYQLNLSNQLGELSFILPPEFDTIYIWDNIKDCDCCDLRMYRFANSNYSLRTETGMFNTQIPDSLFQLTIYHRIINNCDNTWVITQVSVDSMARLRDIEHEDAFFGEEPISWIRKEMLNIDNHSFLLLGYKSKRAFASLGTMTILEAMTVVDDEILTFVGECSGSNCGDFADKMISVLKSIKFIDDNCPKLPPHRE